MNAISSVKPSLDLGTKDVLVKFEFTNPRYLPKGLPVVARLNDFAMDRRHAAAIQGEDAAVAEVGRHRIDRVDTGMPTIQNLDLTSPLFLESDIKKSGLELISAHYYQKPRQEGKFGKPPYFIVLSYSRQGTPMPLPPELDDSLRAFFEGAVWTLNVWDNLGEKPTTLNFKTPSPGIGPKHELVIEKGVLRYYDV